MAVTCNKCLKTISRCDDSIPCSSNSSHLFHTQCVNITVEKLETMKKSGSIKNWICVDCLSSDITSKMENLKENSSEISQTAGLIDGIENIIIKSFKDLFVPMIENLKIEILGLRKEVSNLKVENTKLLKCIRSEEFKLPSDSKKYSELFKADLKDRQDEASLGDISQVSLVQKPQRQTSTESNNSSIQTNINLNTVSDKNSSLYSTMIRTSSNSNSSIKKKNNSNSISDKNTPQAISEGGFTMVKNRKSRRMDRSIVGSGMADDMLIKGVPKYGYLHVCKLDPTLKSEKLARYLDNKGFTGVICEKLESKRPKEYSSFKLTVPAQQFENIKNPNLWPEGSRISHFLFRLNKSKSMESRKKNV